MQVARHRSDFVFGYSDIVLVFVDVALALLFGEFGGALFGVFARDQRHEDFVGDCGRAHRVGVLVFHFGILLGFGFGGFFRQFVAFFDGAVGDNFFALDFEGDFFRDSFAGFDAVVKGCAVFRDFRGIGFHFCFLLAFRRFSLNNLD